MRWNFAACVLAALPAVGADTTPPTFYRDILPILQNRCQACHRAGEIGPMPLETYEQVRPWAKAIREAVMLRKMPPWFADPKYGHFANDPTLTPDEVRTIDQWIARGAGQGNRADAPAARQWPGSWAIGEPDAVLTLPEPFHIAARATVDYQYLIFPNTSEADHWVSAVEIRPTDRSVVHHAVVYVRERNDPWLKDAPRQKMFSAPGNTARERIRFSQTTSDILAVYTPGSGPSTWPDGMAKKIPAGAELVLQVHYTSKAQAASDQMRIGIRYIRQTPSRRVLTLQIGRDDIDIPPGDRHYSLSASGTMPNDVLLLSMLPHMHLRGRSFEYALTGAHGYYEPLLLVQPYDFYWQLQYKLAQPRLLVKGTRLRVTGTFDNSRNNPRNPDASAEVTWGEQSWDEMMIGFFDVAVSPDIDKPRLFQRNSSTK